MKRPGLLVFVAINDTTWDQPLRNFVELIRKQIIVMGCVLQGLVTMLLSVIDSILGRHPAYELSIWKSRVFVFLENHTIFALFLGLSSGWLGWPFFEPWTVSSTCRCLSCWGARNSNSHWQELCWHHCDQWPAASLPMSLLNSGGVKWSSQICQMSTSPKLILSIGQDIPTFTNLHIFQGVPFFFCCKVYGVVQFCTNCGLMVRSLGSTLWVFFGASKTFPL